MNPPLHHYFHHNQFYHHYDDVWEDDDHHFYYYHHHHHHHHHYHHHYYHHHTAKVNSLLTKSELSPFPMYDALCCMEHLQTKSSLILEICLLLFSLFSEVRTEEVGRVMQEPKIWVSIGNNGTLSKTRLVLYSYSLFKKF